MLGVLKIELEYISCFIILSNKIQHLDVKSVLCMMMTDILCAGDVRVGTGFAG